MANDEESISILFPLRSASTNVPTANARMRFTNDSYDDLVIQGLNLVGTGLKPRSKTLKYLKSNNFSTPNVDAIHEKRDENVFKSDDTGLSSPRDDMLPSHDEIDAEFDALLDGHAFLGVAKQNLKTLSYTRKWELIKKEKRLHAPKEAQEDPRVRNLRMILGSLQRRTAVTETLYQLERQLRNSRFITLFVEGDGVGVLNECVDCIGKKSQYVYLCCYKALLNDAEARSAVFRNTEWISYVFVLLVTLDADLRVRLLSTQIIILLTYSTEWSDSLLESLEPLYESWVQAVEKTLQDPDEHASNNALILPKPKQMLIEYSISTLLLIKSIQQLLPSNESKLSCFKKLKTAGIHRVFRLMRELDHEDLIEQIDDYVNLELKVQQKMFNNDSLPEVSYGPQIKSLVESTKDTSLEKPVSKIIETVLDLVNSRTNAESMKLFSVFNSILKYLSDHSLGDGSVDETDSEKLFMTSLDHIMDNLQSHQIANRAMEELDQKKKEIEDLKSELQSLRDEKQVSKGDLLQELDIKEHALHSQQLLIEELQNRLKIVENQLKKEKKQLDLTIAHRDSSNRTANRSVSLFETLKESNSPRRSASLSKSKRLTSLSALAHQGQTNTDNRKNKYVNIRSPFNISNNNSDENLSISPISQPKHHRANLSSGIEQNGNDVVSASETDVPSASTAFSPASYGFSASESTSVPFAASKSPHDTKHNEAYGSVPAPTTESASESASAAAPAPAPPPPQLVSAATAAPPPPPPPLPPLLEKSKADTPEKGNESEKEKGDANVPPAPPLPPPPPPPLPILKDNNSVVAITEPKKAPKALKQIHWEKIDNIKDTLWNDSDIRSDIKEDLDEKGVFNEITNLFEQKVVPIKKKQNRITNKGTAHVSILSRDLAQQFGINLHMFSSYSVEQLLQKVLRCDDDIIKNHSVLEFFNKDDFESIPQSVVRSFEPYSTDWNRGKKPQEDVTKLQRADRIFLELFYNMRYYWKIRSLALLTALTYEKDYYDVLYQLQKIDDATQMLKKSSRLKRFFYIVVEIGNFMNHKQTAGIKLSSLTKLSMVKSSSDKNLSFLHVIERIVREKYPDVYEFTGDLERLTDVGKISIESVEAEVRDFYDKIMRIRDSFERGKLSHTEMHHPDDKFRKKISLKLPSAIRKADLLNNQCKLTIAEFTRVMKYCGEDPANPDSKNNFFNNFSEFLALFQKVSQENKEKEAMDHVYHQRQLLLQKAASRSTPDEEQLTDTVDLLMKRLRKASTDSSISTSTTTTNNNNNKNNNSSPTDSTSPEKRKTSRVSSDHDRTLLTRALTLKSGIQKL